MENEEEGGFIYWYTNSMGECVYVGKTEQSVELRFYQHLNVEKREFMNEVTNIYAAHFPKTNGTKIRELLEYYEQVFIRVLEPKANIQIRSFRTVYYESSGNVGFLPDPARAALIVAENLKKDLEGFKAFTVHRKTTLIAEEV